MIQIQTQQVENKIMYSFEANNTKYDVITENHEQFDVFSKRKNCGFDSQLKCYNSKAELAARSKALNNFVKLIEA